MLERLRGRLSYANVVATLALFIALGGSSYAALTVTGNNVRNGSLTGKDIKRNSLTGRQIREGRLDAVPRARNAARVGGLTAQRLLLKCPPGTLPIADVCIETQPRPPADLRQPPSRPARTSTRPPHRAGGCQPTASFAKPSTTTRSARSRRGRAHRRGLPIERHPGRRRRALHDRRARPRWACREPAPAARRRSAA